jgi:hypothetical protein
MKEHPVNSLDNFIAAWTADDTTICDRLIQYFKDNPTKFAGKTSGGVVPAQKDSTDCAVQGRIADEYLDWLQKVVNKYTEKYPQSNMYAPWGIVENFYVQHYAPNGAFHAWHTERAHAEFPYAQRHLVFMTYLNDVTDAGETEFFHQRLRMRPQKGLTIIWPADWTFTHRGIPSPSQDKYIVTGWLSYMTRRK